MVAALVPDGEGGWTWDPARAHRVPGGRDYDDYEQIARGTHARFCATTELDGRVREQRGRIYRFDFKPPSIPRPDDPPLVQYAMVWLEERQA